MSIKWIPVHVGLEGNERADILAKDGARNGTDYSLQPKDAYRILEETHSEKYTVNNGQKSIFENWCKKKFGSNFSLNI
jgi:hypothetical protein